MSAPDSGGLRGHSKHRGLSVVDLQICATASPHGLSVLHDDSDFTTVADPAVELEERNVHDGPLG